LTGISAVTLTVWLVAPWIVDSSERFIAHSNPQIAEAMSSRDKYAGMEIGKLKEIASRGDAAAQYSVGMRYATGEGVGQDYHQAAGWFLKSANNGDFRAAAKMATCFWSGKGAPRDYSKAYFWGLVAKAGGDQTGQVIVINSAEHLSDHQRFAEQQQADAWLRSHHF
jgi:TPR repeat protein